MPHFRRDLLLRQFVEKEYDLHKENRQLPPTRRLLCTPRTAKQVRESIKVRVTNEQDGVCCT